MALDYTNSLQATLTRVETLAVDASPKDAVYIAKAIEALRGSVDVERVTDEGDAQVARVLQAGVDAAGNLRDPGSVPIGAIVEAPWGHGPANNFLPLDGRLIDNSELPDLYELLKDEYISRTGVMQLLTDDTFGQPNNGISSSSSIPRTAFSADNSGVVLFFYQDRTNNNNQVFYRSLDYGENWEIVSRDINSLATLESSNNSWKYCNLVCAVGAGEFLASGESSIPSTYDNMILHTVDAGNTWTQLFRTEYPPAWMQWVGNKIYLAMRIAYANDAQPGIVYCFDPETKKLSEVVNSQASYRAIRQENWTYSNTRNTRIYCSSAPFFIAENSSWFIYIYAYYTNGSVAHATAVIAQQSGDINTPPKPDAWRYTEVFKGLPSTPSSFPNFYTKHRTYVEMDLQGREPEGVFLNFVGADQINGAADKHRVMARGEKFTDGWDSENANTGGPPSESDLAVIRRYDGTKVALTTDGGNNLELLPLDGLPLDDKVYAVTKAGTEWVLLVTLNSSSRLSIYRYRLANTQVTDTTARLPVREKFLIKARS